MITQEQIDLIGLAVDNEIDDQKMLSDAIVEQLRAKFEDFHFTYCMDDDVVATNPVYEGTSFNLYLVDGGGHCLCFTPDLERATGVVVAEFGEDDAY